MKLTNDEQTKRSLIRTQKRVLDLEAKVERLEDAIVAILGRAIEAVDKRRKSA